MSSPQLQTHVLVPPVNRREEIQLVSFSVADEEFGLEILKVQEIVRTPNITRVPNLPDFVQGVINLRGSVIPVIALRRCMGYPPIEATERARVMVVEVGGDVLGFIVDAVSEVLRVPAESIEPPPRVGFVEREYISGVGKIDDRLLLILDIDKLMSLAEIAQINNARSIQ